MSFNSFVLFLKHYKMFIGCANMHVLNPFGVCTVPLWLWEPSKALIPLLQQFSVLRFSLKLEKQPFSTHSFERWPACEVMRYLHTHTYWAVLAIPFTPITPNAGFRDLKNVLRAMKWPFYLIPDRHDSSARIWQLNRHYSRTLQPRRIVYIACWGT